MTKTILRVSPIRYIGAKVRPHATPWMPLYCVDLVLAKKKKKKKQDGSFFFFFFFFWKLVRAQAETSLG